MDHRRQILTIKVAISEQLKADFDPKSQILVPNTISGPHYGFKVSHDKTTDVKTTRNSAFYHKFDKNSASNYCGKWAMILIFLFFHHSVVHLNESAEVIFFPSILLHLHKRQTRQTLWDIKFKFVWNKNVSPNLINWGGCPM